MNQRLIGSSVLNAGFATFPPLTINPAEVRREAETGDVESAIIDDYTPRDGADTTPEIAVARSNDIELARTSAFDAGYVQFDDTAKTSVQLPERTFAKERDFWDGLTRGVNTVEKLFVQTYVLNWLFRVTKKADRTVQMAKGSIPAPVRAAIAKSGRATAEMAKSAVNFVVRRFWVAVIVTVVCSAIMTIWARSVKGKKVNIPDPRVAQPLTNEKGDAWTCETGEASPLGTVGTNSWLRQVLKESGYIKIARVREIARNSYVQDLIANIPKDASGLHPAAQKVFLLTLCAYEGNGQSRPATSPEGDVGILQINKLTWIPWLKAYNAKNGTTYDQVPIGDAKIYAKLATYHMQGFRYMFNQVMGGKESQVGKMLLVLTKPVPRQWNLPMAFRVWMKGTGKSDAIIQLLSLGPRIITSLRLLGVNVEQVASKLPSSSNTLDSVISQVDNHIKSNPADMARSPFSMSVSSAQYAIIRTSEAALRSVVGSAGK